MIKGLFFKLHDEKPEEADILKFFEEESKDQKISKIKLLMLCVKCYKWARKIENLQLKAFKFEGVE